MIKKIILFFLIFPFVCSLSLSQEIDSTVMDRIIREGIDLMQQEEFDKAVDKFKELINLCPENPVGYFYIAALYKDVIHNYRNENFRKEFEKYVELAIEKGEKINRSQNVSAQDYLYLGGAYGYKGIYNSLWGHWWNTFYYGVKGKNLLEKGLEKDSLLYDAYFGLGSYYYWRSVKSKFLWWLPFFGDHREKGISQIRKAIEKGKFSNTVAKYALVRIYAEEKEYQKVLELTKELECVKKKDIYSLWFIGQAYLGLKNLDLALENYSFLLQALKTSPYYHLAAEVECRYFMACAYFEKKEYDLSLEQIGFILANEKEANKSQFSKPFVEEAEKLRKQIQKNY